MTRLSTFAALALLIAAGSLCAGDWPQFRNDANRSGATAEALPNVLHLQWVRAMPAPRPAFPNEIRLLYDVSYEPVVLGTTLFLPSMVTDSVTALSTETGKVCWRFFCDGPVRFAPVAWRDRVYFVSDDGYLYCVSADAGKLLWKFRGLPSDREDRRILGNGRLISLRPARGGPVLKDGVIYFGAGIWLGDGIFVHALDAKTGKPIWSNTDSHKLAKANVDHGVNGYAGIAPQGYLAVLGDKLVVPCGAQLPAFLDCKTGKLEPYTMGWGGRNGLPKGSWLVAGAGKYLVHSADLYDVGRSNDERFKGKPKNEFKSRLYPGGYTRLLIDPANKRALGDFRDSIITDDTLFFGGSGVIEAYDLTKPTIVERAKIKDGRSDRYPDKWAGRFPKLWSQKSSLTIHLKAGSRLVVGGPGLVRMIEPPGLDGSSKTTWQAKIDGTPSSMLAADGKLFVTTQEGKLYAFGEMKVARPSVNAKPSLGPAPKRDRWTETASKALKTSKVSDGYALVLGADSGRLAEELIRQSKLFVIAIDANGERVRSMRKRFHQQGLYGTRISVHQGDPFELPLPPYFAGLIVAENSSVLGKSFDREAAQRMHRLLRPYGGMACLSLPSPQLNVLAKTLSESNLAGSDIRRTRDFVVVHRPRALYGAADWSHSGADAGNAGASQDRFLKAPLGILSFDASARWHRKPGSAVIRVVAGRTLILSQDDLLALDAYTGRRLWQVEMPPRTARAVAKIAVTSDTIYVPMGKTCLVLDVATGRKQRELTVPDKIAEEKLAHWSQLRARGDYLVAKLGRHLVCLNRHTGKLLWKYECQHDQLSVALGEQRVYCAEIRNIGRRPSVRVINSKPRTQAFDVKTGKIAWSIPDASELRYNDAHKLLVTSKGVYRGKDGLTVRKISSSFTIAGDTMIGVKADQLITYNLLSGRKTSDDLKWYRRGCTGLRACSTLATTRFNGNAAYVDLSSRKITPL